MVDVLLITRLRLTIALWIRRRSNAAFVFLLKVIDMIRVSKINVLDTGIFAMSDLRIF